jgi:hypothetical protein
MWLEQSAQSTLDAEQTGLTPIYGSDHVGVISDVIT